MGGRHGGQKLANFERNFITGRIAEEGVSMWMKKRGCLVLPAYDYSGSEKSKAPKLEAYTGGRSLIIPDLLVTGRGDTKWVEVKFKSEATLTRSTGLIETGFSARLFDDYVLVRDSSGIDVWVFFVHVKEGEVRGADMSRLLSMSRRYMGKSMGDDGMVFFPYYDLDVIASFDEVLDVYV
jgi:hypothetical protein